MASSSSSLSSSMTFTLPLFLLLLSTTNMIIPMTTAFDLRPQSNNNYHLLLSTTRIRIRSYPQPCLPSNHKSSNNYSSRRRGEQQLYMGGYYAEDLTNDNIDNNYDNEDRSKTHMIFGVRCIEKEKSFLIPTTTTTITETAKIDTIEVTVTGLQPLLKDDDDDEDDEDDSIVLRDDDNTNDDDDFVSILLEQANRSLQKQKKLRVVEIGADPIFSLALSKFISSTTISSTGTNDNDGVSHSVTIYHPDERRLRVLDHAYQFFNEIRSNKCSFQTVPLKDDELLNIDSDNDNDNAIHVNCCSWTVLTSAKLVSKRLDAVMMIVAAKSIMANINNHRVFVPSSIISKEQLKRYNYHEVALMGSSSNNNDKIGNDDDSSVVLEILNSK